MTFEEYWDQCLHLSREAGGKYSALLEFLEKNPRPQGILFIEYDRLVSDYGSAFKAWIEFSEKHKDSRASS